jgi:hypothetical protein
MNNLERYQTDLKKLIQLSRKMLEDLIARSPNGGAIAAKGQRFGAFEEEYQRFYSEATAVVRQLLPSRLTEFETLYKGDGKRKAVTSETFNIQDWLLGIRATEDVFNKKIFNDYAAVAMRLQAQVQIIESLQSRFESSLFDIHQLVQADLFDSELDGSRALLKQGFLRAAGVITGVVLEKHLHEVCRNHSVAVKKKSPTIGDLNDSLKEAGVLDIPAWRSIQRLGDLRNLCGHNREREPSPDEVSELIDGCTKVTKTVY